MIKRPPSPNSPASKEIIAASENRESAPCIAGSVSPSSTSPPAISHSPAHCRGPTLKPNILSAITAISTTPPASDTCTTDIGASASAATCRLHEAAATSIPTANHFEENSTRAERSGWRTVTAGTSLAPRYL